MDAGRFTGCAALAPALACVLFKDVSCVIVLQPDGEVPGERTFGLSTFERSSPAGKARS